MQSAKFKDIGLIEYKKAWEFQEVFFNKTLKIKSKIEMKELISKQKII